MLLGQGRNCADAPCGVSLGITRLTSTGQLDTSFGEGGEVVTPGVEVHYWFSNGLAIQPDGKIVAAGSAQTGCEPAPKGCSTGFAIARYTVDGKLDPSFGNGGVKTVSFPQGTSGQAAAFAVAIQPDGKIVAVGSCCSQWGHALARLNPDGSLDGSFDFDGISALPESNVGGALAVTLQNDGKIVTAGDYFTIRRFNTDGSLDLSFGNGGAAEGPQGAHATDVTLDPSGQILAVGIGSAFPMARFLPSGQLDADFGQEGILYGGPFGVNGSDWAMALAVQPNSDFVAAGRADFPYVGTDFAVGRFPATWFKMSVSVSGSGLGTVVSSPTGIEFCPPRCRYAYPSGTPVTLTARPDSGSAFAGWSGGGCSGATTCTVIMDQARSVEATFIRMFALTVSKSGSGSGTVTSSPAGINCGSNCQTEFSSGTQVTLTATAASTSAFAGWSGGGCSGNAPCSITMDQARSVQANFVPKFALTVSHSGTGAGTLTSTPPGIDCGSSCEASYVSGTSVSLTATPESGSAFTGWSGGGCSGAGACTLTMDQARAVQAIFTRLFSLTVSRSGSGSGTITSSPSGISCGSTCQAPFASGSSVSLTAAPDPGSVFSGWGGGGCSGTGMCAVVMDAAKTVGATFTLLPPPEVRIISGPSGVTNDNTPTVEFSSSGAASVSCSVDQGTASFAPCSSSSSHTPPAELADGDYTFRVKATNASGFAIDTRSFTVDTVAPDTSLVKVPKKKFKRTKPSVFGFASPEAYVTFGCSLDGADYTPCTSPRQYAALSRGTHTFRVRATDAAGNVDATPALWSWTIR